MRSAQRSQRKTLLAVGEGRCEVAFLKHLRGLYCSGGLGVSVKIANAYGKGPNNVIDHALSRVGTEAHDRRLCLLDTDIDWPSAKVKKAAQKKIRLIGSDPCLEGLLIDKVAANDHGNPFAQNRHETPPQLADELAPSCVKNGSYLSIISRRS